MSGQLNGWADPEGLAFGQNGFITPSLFNSLRDHVDGKMRFHHRGATGDSDKITDAGRGHGYVPTDIVDGPKDYTFFIDVPGLSKTDVQVTLEEDKILVVKGGGGKGKRKREEAGGGGGGDPHESAEHKYIRLERRVPKNRSFLRKFRLPDDANTSAISAKCENGVLTVVVEKIKSEVEHKTVLVPIA